MDPGLQGRCYRVYGQFYRKNTTAYHVNLSIHRSKIELCYKICGGWGNIGI
jgi:hypothetical protein